MNSVVSVARSVLWILVAVNAAVLAQSGDPWLEGRGRERIEITGLDGDRIRLVQTLGDIAPVAVGEDGAVSVAAVGFLSRWLERELPLRYPGVAEVITIDRVGARSRRGETSATRDRAIEITGTRDAVLAARSFLARLLDRRRHRVSLELSAFTFPARPQTGDEPVVSILDQVALDQALARFRSVPRASRPVSLAGTSESGIDHRLARTERRRFVVDFRVTDVGDRSFEMPVIEPISSGVELDWAALVLPDGVLAVSAALRCSALQIPVETARVPAGIGGRELVVDVPAVSSVRWATDRIELRSGDAGFAVEGLAAPEGRGSDRIGRELVLVARVRSSAPVDRGVVGRVLGVDRVLDLVFVRQDGGPPCHRGKSLVFTRGGDVIGRGVVEEVWNRVLGVRLSKGEPRTGDEAR